MRLFIAIKFSDEIKKALISTMHDLKKNNVGGSYSPADNLHLTLAFIGETKDVEGVKKALGAAPFAPFMLTLTDMGNFGDILWVGAKGGQKLKAYVKALRDKLDAADIRYDRKKFEPHITLVRKASNVHPQGVTVPKKEMMVKRISLMKSEQKNGKMVYTEIFHVEG
ncbi:MAG: RNA 2',3'-cyclic phosphodiesterase [Lachnospiraceae bacterium]|nr:RNA 2',3'-cyclic phosphodiesterase [Lachnospiraceae bacterium]